MSSPVLVILFSCLSYLHVPFFLSFFCLFCVSYELGWCLVIVLRILLLCASKCFMWSKFGIPLNLHDLGFECISWL